MSERKLREGAIQKSLDGSWVCVFCLQHSDEVVGEIEHCEDCPLADDPDMGNLLRWLEQDAKIYIGGFAVIQLGKLLDYIEDEFHIHLTETGWEYLDDQP